MPYYKGFNQVHRYLSLKPSRPVQVLTTSLTPLVALPLARVPSGLAHVLPGALDRRADVGDAVAERLARLARHARHRLAHAAGGSADDAAYCVGNAREGIAENYFGRKERKEV